MVRTYFSFYIVTFFIIVIIVNFLVIYVGHFIPQICRKVVFFSIVFNSTYNDFTHGDGGYTDAVFPLHSHCAAEKGHVFGIKLIQKQAGWRERLKQNENCSLEILLLFLLIGKHITVYLELYNLQNL